MCQAVAGAEGATTHEKGIVSSLGSYTPAGGGHKTNTTMKAFQSVSEARMREKRPRELESNDERGRLGQSPQRAHMSCPVWLESVLSGKNGTGEEAVTRQGQMSQGLPSQGGEAEFILSALGRNRWFSTRGGTSV